MGTTYKVFRGDPALKEEALKRAVDHREFDRLRHGIYGGTVENGAPKFVGCAVGCLATPVGAKLTERQAEAMNDDPHEKLQRRLGIPYVLGKVADGIFESHDREDAGEGYRRPVRAGRNWPERFVKMLPVGLAITDELDTELYRFTSRLSYGHIEDRNRPEDIEAAKRQLQKILRKHAKAQGVAV